MANQRYTSWHHGIFLKIFRFIFGPFFILFYRFKLTKIPIKKTGPYLILCNHSGDFDVIFLDMLFDAPLYFVASEHLLNRGFSSWFLRTFFHPIPKSKSLADIALVKRMKKVVDEGGNLAIFPEGNASMNGGPSSIPDGMGRLIKFLNIPVKLIRVDGIYFSSPRWAYFRKFGPSRMKEITTLTQTEIAQKTPEALEQFVKETLAISAYDHPLGVYRGRRLAEGLHKLIFTCPQCQGLFTTYSTGNSLRCHQCQLHGIYDEQGYLTIANERRNLIEHDQLNLQRFHEQMRMHHQQVVYEVNGKVAFWDRSFPRRTAYQKTWLKFNDKGLQLMLKRGNEFYPYRSIFSEAIQGKKQLLIYPSDLPMLIIRLPRKHSPYALMNLIKWYKYNLMEGTKHDLQQRSASTFLGL